MDRVTIELRVLAPKGAFHQKCTQNFQAAVVSTQRFKVTWMRVVELDCQQLPRRRWTVIVADVETVKLFVNAWLLRMRSGISTFVGPALGKKITRADGLILLPTVYPLWALHSPLCTCAFAPDFLPLATQCLVHFFFFFFPSYDSLSLCLHNAANAAKAECRSYLARTLAV